MSEVLTNLFEMGEPWPEKIIRTIAVYLFLLIAVRVAGKRELGQVTTSDVIVLLLIANTVQNAIIGNETSLIGGLIGAAILIGLNKALAMYGYRHPGFSRVVEGEPVELLRDGNPLPEAMEAQEITVDELLSACRAHGVANFGVVELAILEPHGMISVIPRSIAYAPELVARLDRIEASLRELLNRPDVGLATQK